MISEILKGSDIEELKVYVDQYMKTFFNEATLDSWELDKNRMGIVTFFDIHANSILKLKPNTALYWHAMNSFIYEFAKFKKLKGLTPRLSDGFEADRPKGTHWNNN